MFRPAEIAIKISCLLTLREHTELAGDVFDAGTQRRKLEQSFAVAEVVAVRR